jgi:hypothetical protein
MIKQIALIFNERKIVIPRLEENLFKTTFSIPFEYQRGPLDFEITFKSKIIGLRNSDYQWILPNKNFIATNLAPKILKLANGFYVEPSSTIGVWEYKKNYTNKILWRLNHPDASVITKYEGPEYKKTYQPVENQKIVESVALLFSKKGAIEFSRSRIPFSAVACFTDHCDYDTAENLQQQRYLLNESGVKITKGFFLNHFSKRASDASWEQNSEEYKKWLIAEHELAYHSLSRSIKSFADSKTDFLNFQQLENVVSWIDHGFQPYNFSLFENTKIITQSDYFEKLASQKITTLWNYIDSGTSTTGVINQLNSEHFTLNKFWKGNRTGRIVHQIQRFIKNCFFHFYANETLIENYKAVSRNIKNVIFNQKLKEIPSLIANSSKVLFPLLKIVLFWNSNKNKPYRYAKYNPIVFRYTVNKKKFLIFQTIEILDFEKSLSAENIDLFIREKGLFIAHTYFSVPLEYHAGRMFLTAGKIDQKVANNFKYLGQKIKNGDIWNPTLNELVGFLDNFENVVLDVDTQGNIIVVNDSGLPFRTVN